MFNRIKYKSFAKTQLRDRWGTAIGMQTIIWGIEQILQIIIMVILSSFFADKLDINSIDNEEALYEFYSIAIKINCIFLIINSIITTILQYPASIVYLNMSYSPAQISVQAFFSNFKETGRAIAAFLWNMLWSVLWSFLFFIPGIIKSYAYSQIYLLMAENKDLTAKEAMKVSMIITKNHKADLFIMDLSFIGLFIPTLIFGIAIIFVLPYITLTRINAYHDLLREAIDNGSIPEEYLNKLKMYQTKNNENSEEENQTKEIDYEQKLEYKGDCTPANDTPSDDDKKED